MPGLQLVLPGEFTSSHRHMASALRFVIEGEGAYTAVDGERVSMHPGDLILTPSWTFHDHGNPGQSPVVWLDGLDIPIVNFFDSSFAEHLPDEATQSAVFSDSPAFAFPYAPARDALLRDKSAASLSRSKDRIPERRRRFGYAGRSAHSCNRCLPDSTAPHIAPRIPRCTAIVEGRGTSRIGDRSFEWAARDIFVVPSWCPVSHQTNEDSILFSFSDRPAQKALGLWREQAPLAV